MTFLSVSGSILTISLRSVALNCFGDSGFLEEVLLLTYYHKKSTGENELQYIILFYQRYGMWRHSVESMLFSFRWDAQKSLNIAWHRTLLTVTVAPLSSWKKYSIMTIRAYTIPNSNFHRMYRYLFEYLCVSDVQVNEGVISKNVLHI